MCTILCVNREYFPTALRIILRLEYLNHKVIGEEKGVKLAVCELDFVIGNPDYELHCIKKCLAYK